MLPEHKLWRSILEYNRQNSLGETLVNCLENHKWCELEGIILFYKKIQFIYDFAKEYKKQNNIKYEEDKKKGKIKKKQDGDGFKFEKYMNYNKVYDAGVFFGGKHKQGTHLKNTFYEIIDSLGLKTFQNYNTAYSIPVDSLIEFFCDEVRDDETPMQAFLRWREYQEGIEKEMREEGGWEELFSMREELKRPKKL